MTTKPLPFDYPLYCGRLDNLDGAEQRIETALRVEMTKVPRLQREPIHPPTPAEPVTPETKRGSRALFVAATLVLIAVTVWLTVAVRDAIEQGVFL